MKTLIVIQHCQSEHHVNELTGGWTDTPLTALGRRQASCVAERLRDELGANPCPLYTSDLERTRQTSEIIADSLEVEPVVVRDLREWNLGDATGKTQAWADANRLEGFSGFDHPPFNGAEAWREFHARTCRVMDDLAGRGSERAIVVTHGGTTSNIVRWWLRLSLDTLPALTPFTGAPGSIQVLRTNESGNPVIERLNDRAHLQAAGLGGGLSR